MYEDISHHSLNVKSPSRASRQSLDTESLSSSRSRPSVYASTIWSLENESTRSVPRLNDQQWIMQRKKIGLSRKIKSPKQKNAKSKKEDIVSFIKNNFKRKECVNYVVDPKPKDADLR